MNNYKAGKRHGLHATKDVKIGNDHMKEQAAP